MTNTEDRPSIGERYSSATESSNLRLAERRSDLDLIIAAGLMPDGLASSLYRLQVEYDGVRAEHRAAERQMQDSEKYAERQARDPKSRHRAEAILKGAENSALTMHVLILTQLTSLRETKDQFGRFAVIEATKRKFMRPDREVMILAGQVLDVFLNPRCRHCDGRGFSGGGRHEQSGAQVPCRPCRASGSRRAEIGRDDAQRLFASHLLMQTDAMMFQAERDIRTGLNRVAVARDLLANAES